MIQTLRGPHPSRTIIENGRIWPHNIRVGKLYPANGKRECARRVRQMQRFLAKWNIG